MNDLAKKLQIYKRFPKIFEHRNSAITKPQEIWIESGWLPLFENFCRQINALAELNHLSEEDWPYFTDVKQKLGALRIYMRMQGFDEDTKCLTLQYKIEAQEAANVSCEHCGQTGVLRKRGGWIHVYCDPCEEQYLNTGERL